MSTPDVQTARTNGPRADSKADATDFIASTGHATAVREKDFCTLRAEFAMLGHGLHRSDPKDGPVTFYVERWGMVRHLRTQDDARRFLGQIGGAK